MLCNAVDRGICHAIFQKQILRSFQYFLYILFSDLTLIHSQCPAEWPVIPQLSLITNVTI